MSKKPLDNVGARLIPLGSCTWCGHKPHTTPCSSAIRTDAKTESPCPCSHHTEGTRP